MGYAWREKLFHLAIDSRGKDLKRSAESPFFAGFEGLLQNLSDTLFPRYCVVCRRRLTAGERFLCASCLLHLPLTRLKGRKNNLVERILWDEVVRTERANSFLYYTKGSDYSEIYFGFKYFGNPRLATYVGELVARDLLTTDFFTGIDYLIPVPLAPKRERQRGYNQSEYLARGIARMTGIQILTQVVVRVVSTGTQTNLDFDERRKNVDRIFEVRDVARLENRHLLLVDDVITTGSTMRALARCLLAVPGVKVSVVSLAVSSYHRQERFPDSPYATVDEENGEEELP